MERKPPMAMMAAVKRIGMALLTAIKLPNVTLPKMAAILPRHDWKPNAVVLQHPISFKAMECYQCT